MKKLIRVGDTVLWRGSFGTAPALPAKVTNIELCESGEKYGESVRSIPVECLNNAVFNLDNGHWARGRQISVLESEEVQS